MAESVRTQFVAQTKFGAPTLGKEATHSGGRSGGEGTGGAERLWNIQCKTEKAPRGGAFLSACFLREKVAPAVGFEPTTNGLTVRCATAAPRRNITFANGADGCRSREWVAYIMGVCGCKTPSATYLGVTQIRGTGCPFR
jgi:hypothetical protein